MIDTVFFIWKVCNKKRRILCRFQICGCWLEKKYFQTFCRWPTETVWLRAYFGIFQKILGFFGLFLFVLKQFCLFQLFQYRFKKHWKKPKQTKNFCFWFHKTNWNKTENRSCFGLFWFELFFVCFEDTLPPTLWSYSTRWGLQKAHSQLRKGSSQSLVCIATAVEEVIQYCFVNGNTGVKKTGRFVCF